MNLIYEAFSLRDGEYVSLGKDQPTEGTWFAVMAKSVPQPPGEIVSNREVPGLESLSVEMAAIIACQIRMSDNKYVWMQLSPMTKEIIGDLMFDCKAELDQWYFATVLKQRKDGTP